MTPVTAPTVIPTIAAGVRVDDLASELDESEMLASRIGMDDGLNEFDDEKRNDGVNGHDENGLVDENGHVGVNGCDGVKAIDGINDMDDVKTCDTLNDRVLDGVKMEDNENTDDDENGCDNENTDDDENGCDTLK